MSNHYDPMIHNRTLPVGSEDGIIYRQNLDSERYYARQRQNQMLVVASTLQERPIDPRAVKQLEIHDTTLENRTNYYSLASNEAALLVTNMQVRPIDTRRVYAATD